MRQIDCQLSYPNLLAHRCAPVLDEAPEAAAEGADSRMGQFMCALLVSLGLEAGQLVIDVGCGSSWLASQLASLPRLRYIGTDVSADLLASARAHAQRDDWLFVRGAGDVIPCAANAADFVCFFSLFAHLLPQDAIRHLTEAKRVLRPGGHVAFSFFEFMTSRAVIAAWARRTGLQVGFITDGSESHPRFAAPFFWPDGGACATRACFGQSVAVLSKSTAHSERILPVP